MTNAEMHSIQVQDAPVFLKRTLAPGIILLGQALVEATDRAGTGRHSHERLGHFSYFMGTGPSYKQLHQSFGNVRLIATVAVKDLCVELAFPVPGHIDPLDATGSGDQITGVGAVAIAFTLGATFSPAHADERIKLLAHDALQHDAN